MDETVEGAMMAGQRKLQALNEAWQEQHALPDSDKAAFTLGFEAGFRAASTPEEAAALSEERKFEDWYEGLSPSVREYYAKDNRKQLLQIGWLASRTVSVPPCSEQESGQ
jgi:hypothetical protein